MCHFHLLSIETNTLANLLSQLGKEFAVDTQGPHSPALWWPDGNLAYSIAQ